MRNDVFKNIVDDINASSMKENDKEKILKRILTLKENRINLLITGATGCGKSSTINALFNTEVAKVGIGVDPETMSIQKYELDKLILWDSPGLGDGKEKDAIHSKNIIKKLNELDSNKKPLIDLVLVILDGSSRDLGTSYELINKVIIPNLGKNAKKRILVAINQADVAMKGRYWDYENNTPEDKLVEFLNDKVISVKERIKEATNIDIEPIYYSAGYKDEDKDQNPWNLSKLLYFIVKNTPSNKRLSYIGNISEQEEIWQDNDQEKNYTEEIQKSFIETIKETTKKGAEIGAEIGEVIGEIFNAGKTGKTIGKTVGGIVGGVKGIIKKFW